MRLITIPLSHYCERARWALDYVGLSYIEHQHLQLFHSIHTRKNGGGQTVPVLVTKEGQVLSDSATIVEYADCHAHNAKHLYPKQRLLCEETKRLERLFAGEFGVETRRAYYYYFFRWGRPGLIFNAGNAPHFERWMLNVGFPIAAKYAKQHFAINKRTLRNALLVVERTFDSVAKRLSDGPFLIGNSFTAADMTFACMAAPVIAPPHYGVRLPTLDDVTKEMRALFVRFRNHPAGQFALRMFKEHRLQSKSVSDAK